MSQVQTEPCGTYGAEIDFSRGLTNALLSAINNGIFPLTTL